MKSAHPMCERPDRDVPKIKCGYPLPCPWHTVVIDASQQLAPSITVPAAMASQLSPKTLGRLGDIASVAAALAPKEKPSPPSRRKKATKRST